MSRRSRILDPRPDLAESFHRGIRWPVTKVDGPDTGIEFTYIGGGRWEIFIPDGTGPHASFVDGRGVWFRQHDLVTGRPLTWPDGYTGEMQPELDVLTPPPDGSDVELALGFSRIEALADAPSRAGFAGLSYIAGGPAVIGTRIVGGAVSASVDGFPTGNSTKVHADYSRNVATAALIAGVCVVSGLREDGVPDGAPFDVVGETTNIRMEPYVVLWVHCPTAIVGDTTVIVRPKCFAVDHRVGDP